MITTVPDALAVYLDVGAMPAELLTKLKSARRRDVDRAVDGTESSRRSVAAMGRADGTELVLQPHAGRHRARPRFKFAATTIGTTIAGSYWQPENLRGIDRGEASPLRYAFKCLIGHHGLFSLTPIWLLSAAGCVIWLRT